MMITLIFLIAILIAFYCIFTITDGPFFKEGDLLVSRYDLKEFGENKPSLKVLKVGKENYLLKIIYSPILNTETNSFHGEYKEALIKIIDDIYVKYEK